MGDRDKETGWNIPFLSLFLSLDMASFILKQRPRWRILFQRRYLFHLLFWVMYAVFTILEMQGYSMKRGFTFSLQPLLIYFTLMALLVYGNTLLLIPLLLEKKKVLIYISGIIFFVILYTYFRSLNQQYWDAIIWPEDIMSIQSYYKWNFLYAIWFLIISSMLFFTQKWSEQQQKVKNIEISQLKTELKYLRSQLNPHFLFNGLNTIYGNIDIRDEKARDILVQFSDLLRYSLYEADVDWVILEKEAVYLQNYVALQKARSNTNLLIELDIGIEDPTIKVAPLIFIVFVENAFKFSSREDNIANYIKIALRQSGSRIVFDCSNSYEDPGQVVGGIGLNNVTRRLELLYKDRHELTIKKEQGVYSVQLIINT
jgi:two-component system, LytTR family, sensor kinase